MTYVEWHKKLGNGAIVDEILDWAVSKSNEIFLEESLRKLNKTTGTNCPIYTVLKNATYMVL